MTESYVFPSIEKLLAKWLPTYAPLADIHVTAELPHNFQDPDGPTHMLPVIVVDRISGADLSGSPLLDRPVIDIDCYAGTRGQAQDMAEQVRHALRWTLPGSHFDGTVFTRTRTVVGPRLLPHANPAVRRYTANYELLLHVQP